MFLSVFLITILNLKISFSFQKAKRLSQKDQLSIYIGINMILYDVILCMKFSWYM